MTIDSAPNSSALAGEFSTVSSLIRHAHEAPEEITANARAEADAILAEAKRTDAEARLVYTDAQTVRADAESLHARAEDGFESAKIDAGRMVFGSNHCLHTSAVSHAQARAQVVRIGNAVQRQNQRGT